MSRFILGFIFIFALSGFLKAQEIMVHGAFQQDSMKIGEVLAYSVTATYPISLNILFPDSTFSFFPFEIRKKIFFPTKSTDSVSYDSVVYMLSSFEIDSIQRLRLPVFIVHPGDCTAVYTPADSIFLTHLVVHLPDSVSIAQLPLKTNTAYQAVDWLLNYPYLLIIGGSILLLCVMLWLFFGKRIKKYLILRKLHKKHREFIKIFNHALEKIQNSYSQQQAELILTLWKSYMEQLLAMPFTKLTTKEIFSVIEDTKLRQALHWIDRTAYSGQPGSEKSSLFQLQQVSEDLFNKKIEEVKHG